MAAGKSSSNEPTLRAMWLAEWLRSHREELKFTQEEVGDYLEKHRNTVRNFESARFPIAPEDLNRLFDLYRIADEQERANLLQLREDVVHRGWTEVYKPYMTAGFADYVWLEGRARAMSQVDVDAIPGLLQTKGYATALISRGPQRDDLNQVDRLIEARMMRKRIITGDSGSTFRFLVAEAALHQHVGGLEVMTEQLQQLLRQADSPNIELRVLPLESWSHIAAGIPGGFTIFELSRPFPDVACMEVLAGAIFKESPDIDLVIDAFDAVWDDALSADETKDRISHLLAKDNR